MKLSGITMVALLFFSLASCMFNKHEYLYRNYTGTQPASEMMDENGNLVSTPAREIKVRIDPRKISIDGQAGEYSISEENNDYLILKAVLNTDKGMKELQLRYNRLAQELVILDTDPLKNIILLTEEKMMKNKLDSFAPVPLQTDISHLTDNQKQMLPILFRVAEIMDEIFWLEAWGDKQSLMESAESETLRELFHINYGPWERLNDNRPLISRFGDRPAGGCFYPADMTVEEFQAWDDPDKTNLYTIITRDSNGKLKSVWYYEYFREQIEEASALLKKASLLADNEGFKKYLELRAEALLTDQYYESDVAWMLMKDNPVDMVVGPIENYEDQLFSYKAGHEAFILIKDMEWSKKLNRLAALLPEMQNQLPVDPKYKQETAGSSSDLFVYDAVYFAGDCNAGSKTIAINLPNDPLVRTNYGSRKLQLKNAIRYKFERILVPISNVLIAEDQRKYIDFDAFFENTMFHEVAHALGLDYTINGKGPVREALKETYSSLEEGKADIIGLYIAGKMAEMGELGEKDIMTNYVTFMAGIFRSVRFGAASAHGKANMVRFNYFREAGAFTRDNVTGTYRLNYDKMKVAVEDLIREIISLQGLGDYDRARVFLEEKGVIGEQLRNDLNRLNEMSIPVDLVFEQGPKMLGLEAYTE